MGSSIDDFMKEEGIFEEAQAQAVKEVVARQLAEAMRERKISILRVNRFLLRATRSPFVTSVDQCAGTRAESPPRTR